MIKMLNVGDALVTFEPYGVVGVLAFSRRDDGWAASIHDDQISEDSRNEEKKKSKLVAVFIILFVTAFSVQAQGFMPWTEVFVMADTNGDGVLVMTEVMEFQPAHTEMVGFSPWTAENFDAMDTDGDGSVSMEEMKAYIVQMDMTDDEVSEGFYKGFGFMPKNQ